MKYSIYLLFIVFLVSGCLDTSNDLDFDNSEDLQFLEENAQRDDVTVTESGLQYRVISESEEDGEEPGPEDIVTVHYRGELIDGRVFDSSYNRGEPSTFALEGVIQGFSEGVQLMTEGDVYELVVPSELAYGDRQMGIIYPGATLIFEVDLIEIVE